MIHDGGDFFKILKKLLSSLRYCWGDDWQQSWREYWNKFINIFFLYIQDPDDLKEVTIIMERLLRRLLTTMLKRMFEIRKEKKVNIDEFILSILFRSWSMLYPPSWRYCWGEIRKESYYLFMNLLYTFSL